MAETIHGTGALIRRIQAVAKVGPGIAKKWQIRTVDLAKRNTIPHRKTGNLGRTIHVGTLTEDKATVEVGADYALFVEENTRPHDIVPVHARVLAWGGDRRLTGSLRSSSKPTHFAMRVRHPGTTGIHFLRNAAEQAAEDLGIEEIVTAWNEAA